MKNVLLAILLIANQVIAPDARAAEVAPASSASTSQNPQEACVSLVNSPVCQSLEDKKGLITQAQCHTQADGDSLALMKALGGCASSALDGAITSFKDIGLFLWNSVKFMVTAPFKTVGGIYNYLSDEDTRSATHDSLRAAMESAGDYLGSVYPYLMIEYHKAYDSVGAPWNTTETSRALKAAMNLKSQLVQGLLGAAWNIIKAQYEEVMCYDRQTQTEMACKLAGSIFVPPAAFFGLIKKGVNGLTGMPKLTAKLEEMFKKSRKLERNLKQADEVLDALKEGKHARELAKLDKVNLDKTPEKFAKSDEVKSPNYKVFEQALEANNIKYDPKSKEILGSNGASPNAHKFGEIAQNIREKHGIQILSDESAFKNLSDVGGFAGTDKNGRRFVQLNPVVFRNMDEAYGTLLHETKHATNEKYLVAGADRKIKPSNIRFVSEEGGIGVDNYKNFLRSEEAEAQLISQKVMEMTGAPAGDIKIRSLRAKNVNLAQQEMLRKVKDRIEKMSAQNRLKHLLLSKSVSSPKIVTRRIEIKMNGKPVKVDVEFMMAKNVDFDEATLKVVNDRIRQLENSSALKGTDNKNPPTLRAVAPVEEKLPLEIRDINPPSVRSVSGSVLAKSQLLNSKVPGLVGPSAVENSLKASRVLEMKNLGGGISESYIIKLEDGSSAVWKPHKTEYGTNYRAEVLAYQVDRKLGFNLVPETVERTIDGRVGSVQLFRKAGPKDVPLNVLQIKKQDFFDYVIQNKDRHNGNWIKGPTGEVISIDHGLSFTGHGAGFADYQDLKRSIERYLQTADGKTILGNIDRTRNDAAFKEGVVQYLGEKDAKAFFDRLNFLAEKYK